MTGAPMKSSRGKEILIHAMSNEYCVLEFKEMDNGEHRVMDITEHVEQLEKKVENKDYDAL